jgi:hypothetical protein
MPRSDKERIFPSMVLYELTSNWWQKPSNFLMGLLDIILVYNVVSSSMAFQDAFQGIVEYWLWSYNHVEDAQKDTSVNLHFLELIKAQLIINNNQPYFVLWLQKLSSIHIYPFGTWLYKASEAHVMNWT